MTKLGLDKAAIDPVRPRGDAKQPKFSAEEWSEICEAVDRGMSLAQIHRMYPRYKHYQSLLDGYHLHRRGSDRNGKPRCHACGTLILKTTIWDIEHALREGKRFG